MELDGARIQVHRAGDRVAVYTRNLNDVTSRVPEVVEAVLGLEANELILDGEVIALADGGRPLVSGHHAAIRPEAQRRDVARPGCR